MKYVYPIVIEKQLDQTYIAKAPDLLGIVVSGSTLTDVVQSAQDACAMWLSDAENSREKIPVASDDFIPPAGTKLALISCDTDAYRRMNDTAPVRKTVSIPSWMANQADHSGISLSKILQDALRSRFGAQ